MSSPTQIITIKRQLVEQIGLLSDLAGVVVSWSHPGGRLEREHVVVGGTVGASTQDFASIGTRARSDEFVIQVDAVVIQPGVESGEEVELRALQIVNVIEEWLRANPDLGLDLGDLPGVKALTADMTQIELKPFFTEDGRGAAAETGVRIKARI